MKRDISAGTETASQAGLVRPVFLFEADFVDEFIRVWNGVGPLAWGALTFDGVGTLGTISAAEETDEVKANGITVSLSAVPTSMIAFVFQEVQRSRFRTATVYIGAIDDAGQLVDDPFPWISGRIAGCALSDATDGSATVQLTIDHELVDLERPLTLRYDDAQQQRQYPGDVGLQYLLGLQNKVLNWGQVG